jgi:hypothetical protein
MPPVPGAPPLLLLSILALFAGPLLYQWLRKGGRVARAVETSVVAVLVLVVVFLLVPDTYRELGMLSVALILAGYLVPGLLELAVHRAAHAFHIMSLMLALLGLVAHAMLDGAGLVTGSGGQASATLGLAIVLHRFGMGLVLWFMVQPVFGRRWALAVLTLVALATVAGYWLSEPLLALDNGGILHFVEPLIIGTIIHSLVHREHGHGPAEGRHTHGPASRHEPDHKHDHRHRH